MKSVAIHAFGTVPGVIDLPLPDVGPRDILVRMTHASLNPIDRRIAEGFLKDRIEHRFPLVLGIDGAGVVEAVGAQVGEFHAGDFVFGRFLHAYVGNGSFSEHVALSAAAPLIRIPAGLAPELAVALPTAAVTALQAVERLALPEGSVVLVTGASGGVGTFAVQLAHAKGYKVLATASRDDAPWLEALGVEYVLDRHENVLEQLYAYCPTGINGLIDLVNPAPAFMALADYIAPGGTALSTIWAAADGLAARGIRGVNLEMEPNLGDLSDLAQRLLDGSLRAVIGRRISLEAVCDAMTQSQAGGARGKTVIDIARH
ncbi:NADP-dependent oxidoreductase [Lysobacter sp. ISL-50]|uniref:NADP-dependent oxidoreductase n=1 Tax=unclassified Lysobacter TaxID=2635362 RepID=UPI001BE58EC5|nr:NADP-dependent oxidoreductase [Lysobacter sp. ISL-50]MBT2775365.1 NADP-dependent oxidoreductase [Lysobacter sp. ISL-54]MBT2783488.1 NADP-dependent oxidoreductase [Lysobacter sp. ISL-52]